MENSTMFTQDKPVSHEGSSQPPRMGRLAAASSIGTTLEWFDFTIYNLMAALGSCGCLVRGTIRNINVMSCFDGTRCGEPPAPVVQAFGNCELLMADGKAAVA